MLECCALSPLTSGVTGAEAPPRGSSGTAIFHMLQRYLGEDRDRDVIFRALDVLCYQIRETPNHRWIHDLCARGLKLELRFHFGTVVPGGSDVVREYSPAEEAQLRTNSAMLLIGANHRLGGSCHFLSKYSNSVATITDEPSVLSIFARKKAHAAVVFDLVEKVLIPLLEHPEWNGRLWCKGLRCTFERMQVVEKLDIIDDKLVAVDISMAGARIDQVPHRHPHFLRPFPQSCQHPCCLSRFQP